MITMKKEKKHSKNTPTKLLSQLIDKKIEARATRTERTLRKMYAVLKTMKSSHAPSRIHKLEQEVASLHRVLDDFNVKDMEDDIFKQFNKINATITETMNKQEATIKKAEAELLHLRHELRSTQRQEHQELSPIIRDLESLKTKTEWVELEFEKLDIQPLLDRLNEIEARIDAMRLSSPTIIE